MSTPAQRLQADRDKFPGLLPREILVLKAWLKMHEAEYDSFDYNVRIGQGHDPGAGWPEELRQMAIMNSQKRLDAVAWKSGQPTIVEVKDRATLSAVGQISMYLHLYVVDYSDGPTPKLLIVANRASADMAPLLQATGVELNLVQVDYSVLAGR